MGRIDGTSERPHHFEVSKSRFGRFHTGNLEDVFFLRKPRCRFLKKDSVGLDQDMRPPVRSKPDRWEWEVRFFCWELVDLGIFDGTKAYFKSIRDGRVIVS